MRRVGILVRTSLWGGLERHALDLARILQHRGRQPVMLCGDDRTAEMFRRELDGSIPVESVPQYGAKAWLTLARALHRLDLDACIFEKGALHAGGLAFDAVARLTCRRLIAIQQLAPPALPARSTRRVFGIPSPNLWRRRMIWRGKLRSLFPNVTVCVSDAVAERLRQDYRFPARRLVTIRNGVDVDRFQEDAEARLRLRAEWQIPRDALLFGAVSRLVPEKGIDLCLEAFQTVRQDPTLRPMRLVIVGDGPERPRLEQTARQLGLSDCVLFAGFRADMPAVLSSIDVLVLSSHLEGLPLTVLEAMSVGRPVIATQVSGTPEIFTRANLGWLVRPNDAEQLAQALRAATRQTEGELSEMRAAARGHVVERFNAFREYARIETLIDR
jgi:glycosyltransferase involved in cell wall biosynthesis